MQHLPDGPVPPGSPRASARDPPLLFHSAWAPRNAPWSPMEGQSLGWLPEPGGSAGSGWSVSESRRPCAAGTAAGGPGKESQA